MPKEIVGSWFLGAVIFQGWLLAKAGQQKSCQICIDLQYRWPRHLPYISGEICTGKSPSSMGQPSSPLSQSTVVNSWVSGQDAERPCCRNWTIVGGELQRGSGCVLPRVLCSASRKTVSSFSLVIFMFLTWVLYWFWKKLWLTSALPNVL